MGSDILSIKVKFEDKIKSYILNKTLNLYTLICLLAIGVSSDYEIVEVSPQGQIAYEGVLILANSLHIINKALYLYTLICLLAIGVSSDYEIVKVSPQGQIAHERVLILANSLHILNKANQT